MLSAGAIIRFLVRASKEDITNEDIVAVGKNLKFFHQLVVEIKKGDDNDQVTIEKINDLVVSRTDKHAKEPKETKKEFVLKILKCLSLFFITIILNTVFCLIFVGNIIAVVCSISVILIFAIALVGFALDIDSSYTEGKNLRKKCLIVTTVAILEVLTASIIFFLIAKLITSS